MTSVDGLITGLDTTDIINQLLAADRIPQNQLLVQQASAEARAAAFADLSGRYDAVRTAAQALDLPDDWEALAATSSDELVQVSTTSGSITGALSFNVVQRAQAHAVYSTDTLSSLDDVIAAGGSIFSARDFTPLGFSDLDGAGLAVGEQTFEVTQASVAAVKPGDTELAENVTIDGTNDTIDITVNGIAQSLTIEHGTYETRADLAAAVRTSISDVVGLSGSLSVTVNPVDQLEFSTVREGSAATLQVTGGTALTDLGLSTDASVITGTDGIVSVNGNDTTITNTDAGSVISLNAGTGTIDATLSGGIDLGTASVEQVSFGNGTLSEVVTAINGAGSRNTNAAIIQVAEGQYRLQLSANETGASSAIGLDLAQFTGLASGFTTLTDGQDAQIEIQGTTPYTITSSSDSFKDLLPGVDVTLTGVPTGTVTIDVTRDSDTLASRIESFVSAVNNVVSGLQQASAYDSETETAALLTGSSTVRRALDEITSSIINPVTGAGLGSVGLTGLTINNDGTFSFDKGVFQSAYEADPDAVERVYSVPFGSDDESVMSRVLAEIDDATTFGTGYLRSAEDAETARVDDLAESISAWDRRLEIREQTLRAVYTRLETNLAQLNAQSTWLAGQIANLSTGAPSG
ncbi:MAG: flagellar filament capping protein FliD [Actinomycetota bacterium]